MRLLWLRCLEQEVFLLISQRRPVVVVSTRKKIAGLKKVQNAMGMELIVAFPLNVVNQLQDDFEDDRGLIPRL
jgi:hypothetical protein